MAEKLKWMKTDNFGDALNPHLFKFISGKSPDYVKSSYSNECYIMIGSILNWSKGKNICWGCGFAQEHINNELNGNILAVRGPLSRQVLIKNNVDCPKIYGDPAILIANYFNPNVNKKYKLGVIPHIVDFSSVNTSKEILKINLKDDYRTVIRQILSCEHIISSSLHGLIVADAYNIPTAWVEFSDKVIGNGFKFRDYYMSINVKNPTRINLRKNKSIDNLDIIEKTDFYNNRFLSDRLLDVCPFKK